jgi:hypothetical protein
MYGTIDALEAASKRLFKGARWVVARAEARSAAATRGSDDAYSTTADPLRAPDPPPSFPHAVPTEESTAPFEDPSVGP